MVILLGWLSCAALPACISGAHAAEEGVVSATDPGANLGAGDVLHIAVWGEEKWNGDFMVDRHGVLYYPPVGSIDVGKMTVRDFTEQLTGRLKKMLKRPYVIVTVKERKGAIRVAVWGEVAKPGVFEVPTRSTLFELLVQAGPLPTASRKVKWVRPGAVPPVQVVDVEQVITQGEWQSQAGTLQEGDTVIVPKADLTSGVTVLGQVQKPGSYPWSGGMQFLTALTAAGGLATESEAQKARILRAGKPAVVIDLERLLRGGDLSLNCPLEQGDIVIVGAARLRVSVLGQVIKPGNYPIPADGTVLDALLQAGGATEKGDLMHAQVTHGTKHQVIDLWKILWEGDTTANLTLTDGDVVMIPPISKVYVLGAIQKPGEITPDPDTKLFTALERSGGVLEGADVTHLRVVHRGEVKIVDANKLLREGDLKTDTPLEPGDSVFVPLKKNVYVMGAVAKGGPFPINEGDTIMDLLRSGVAPMPEAQLRKVLILRTSEGRFHPLEVNLDRLIKKGDASQNAVLQTGDLIVVPGAKASTGKDIWQYLGMAGNLAWSLRLLLGTP